MFMFEENERIIITSDRIVSIENAVDARLDEIHKQLDELGIDCRERNDEVFKVISKQSSWLYEQGVSTAERINMRIDRINKHINDEVEAMRNTIKTLVILVIVLLFAFVVALYHAIPNIATSESFSEPVMVTYTMPAPEPTYVEPVVAIEVVSEEPAEEIPETKYFDVPLDEDLQDHIFAECEAYGVDPALVMAVIWRETRYQADLIGDNGKAFGLMQVQPRWHWDRMERLGVEDLLNPYQNVTVGIDFLAELLNRGRGLEWALEFYNGSDHKEAYRADVIEKMEELTYS